MTKAGETDHDKELQKAFAEFKESLRHDPHAPRGDAAPKLNAPEIMVAEPRRPAAPQPKLDTRPVLGSSVSQTEEDLTIGVATRQEPDDKRRRGLLYLSAAIVVTGLAALGWTLNHGLRPLGASSAPETAAVAPETPAADTAATTETPASPAAAEATAPKAPQTAATPTEAPAAPPAPAAAERASTPDAPAPAAPPPVTEKAALSSPPAAEAASPPSPAAPAPTPTPASADGQKASAKPTATQADAGAATKPKPAAKPKVAKAKPKPAPARNASRPTTSAAAKATPAATPAAEPVAETAPPPTPPSNDGPLGFVKRTVNSVGSTITNIGRGATGN